MRRFWAAAVAGVTVAIAAPPASASTTIPVAVTCTPGSGRVTAATVSPANGDILDVTYAGCALMSITFTSVTVTSGATSLNGVEYPLAGNGNVKLTVTDAGSASNLIRYVAFTYADVFSTDWSSIDQSATAATANDNSGTVNALGVKASLGEIYCANKQMIIPWDARYTGSPSPVTVELKLDDQTVATSSLENGQTASGKLRVSIKPLTVYSLDLWVNGQRAGRFAHTYATNCLKPTLSVASAAVRPEATGVWKVGHTVTASHGTWAPKASRYTYQWMRMVNNTTVKIPGATSRTYKIVDADQNRIASGTEVRLWCVVTAYRKGYPPASSSTSIQFPAGRLSGIVDQTPHPTPADIASRQPGIIAVAVGE